MRERGSLGRRASRGEQRSLSLVAEFPVSRCPQVRGGKPGACSSRTALPGTASSRAGRGQRESKGARKSLERGMRGLRARRGGRNGGLHRGGPARSALGLVCAPNPESATPPPGKGKNPTGCARSVAENRVRVFGPLCALLEGWETRVRAQGLDRGSLRTRGPPRSGAGPRSPRLSPATWVTRLTSSSLLPGVGEAGVEGWGGQRHVSRRQGLRRGRERIQGSGMGIFEPT